MNGERTRMEQAIDRLRQLQAKDGDTETQHQMADEVLCEMLRQLGCHKLVKEWEKVPKWYA